MLPGPGLEWRAEFGGRAIREQQVQYRAAAHRNRMGASGLARGSAAVRRALVVDSGGIPAIYRDFVTSND